MKTSTPRGVALLSALALAVLVQLLVIILFLVTSQALNWIGLVILFVAVVVVAYFVFLASIENFIHKKIKLIYKTIHRKKRSGQKVPQLENSQDILTDVKKEVELWADQQTEEIEGLKQQEEYRREFIGNVSHELKTPLFNVQGYILTLLEGGLDDPSINMKYLKRAEKSLNRLTNIVDDLDEITQFESGRLKLYSDRTNIVELASDVMESLELKAKDSGIKMEFQKPYEPIFVNADKGRIKQVFTNLIVNSIKYGREEGTTEIRFFDMDENILIEVADDGPGISERHLPRLFERFYRVEESRSRDKGGSGLGLAIVKHIIEAHGQTINVRSTEKVGSTFSFTLKKA